MTYELFSSYIEEKFQNKQWKVQTCKKCGSRFLAKVESDVCGRLSCVGGVQLPRRRGAPISLSHLYNHMSDFFLQRGYHYASLPSIRNPQKDTSFVVAAIQYFNAYLDQGFSEDSDMIFAPQPCVRLKDFPLEFSKQGFLKSFVNVASIKIGASIQQYCKALDDWIDYISSIGIHASNLRIVFCDSYVNIRNLYYGWGIDLVCNGLEIGHCNYYDAVCVNGKEIQTGIDCGFCIERFLWLVNGGTFWGNLLSEDMQIIYNKLNLEAEDLMRTIVLAHMSGITIGPRNDGFQLKRMIKRLITIGYPWPLLHASISHYYRFWEFFVRGGIDLDCCYQLIYNAFHKAYLDTEKCRNK